MHIVKKIIFFLLQLSDLEIKKAFFFFSLLKTPDSED